MSTTGAEKRKMSYFLPKIWISFAKKKVRLSPGNFSRMYIVEQCSRKKHEIFVEIFSRFRENVIRIFRFYPNRYYSNLDF